MRGYPGAVVPEVYSVEGVFKGVIRVVILGFYYGGCVFRVWG